MISLVIPAFNEETRLGESLEKLEQFLKDDSQIGEVIVVDDGSSDKTIQVAESFQSRIRNLRIVKNPQNLGKGAAVNMGFSQAQGDIVVFSDADLSTPISELPKLIEPLNSGYDIAIGSRALDRSLVKTHQNFLREAIGKLANVLIRTLAVKGIYDTQCGFKAFRKASAENVFARQTINGFAFDVEILFLAQRQGLKIKEVAVLWYNDTRSSVRTGRDVFLSLVDLFRIRLRHSHEGRGTFNKALHHAHNNHTFVRFFLVGITGTLVDYSTYFFLTRFLGFGPLQANPFSVETAIVWSFLLNNAWTFSHRQNQRHILQRFLVFQFVSLGGLMISQMQILIFIHYLRLHDLLAKILTIPFVGLFNFTINSKWTFKDVSRSGSLARIYPLAILALIVVYLLLVKKLTGSYSLFLNR